MTKNELRRIIGLIRSGLEEASSRLERIDLDAFQKEFEETYSEELDGLAHDLARRQLHREIKKIALAMFGDEDLCRDEAEQLTLLPGRMQQFYTVPGDGGGFLYVPALAMTWPDWEGHALIIENNRAAAEVRELELREQMDMLRPFMQGTKRTLQEALAVMRAKGVGV